MTAIFRVNADVHTGSGHIMRCLALAQAFEQVEVSSLFVINADAEGLCRARHDWVGNVVVLPRHVAMQQEPAWLSQLVQAESASMLVLDGYQFDQDYRQQLAALPVLNICFDDNNSLPALHTDVVINGASNADSLGYAQTAPGATLCLGEAHRVMRQEFVHPVNLDWSQRLGLTIVMGGSDPKQLTLPLLHALQRADFAAPIRVITGAAFTGLAALKDFVRHSPLSIQHIHDCQQIADVFSRARLVLSAAGGSQFELMACATPAILFVVADNQVNATKQASSQGWCETVDARGTVDFDAVISQAGKLWGEEARLQHMSELAAAKSDTGGAQRVVEAIRHRLGGRRG